MAKPLQAAIQYIIDDGTYAKIVTKWGWRTTPSRRRR